MLAASLLVSVSLAAGDPRGPFGQDPTPVDVEETARDAVGKLLVTRQDLAELVQRLDALLAGPLIRGELTGAALRAVNERFDRISLQFFGGDFAAVHAALAEWVGELSPGSETAGVLRLDLEHADGFSPRGSWPYGVTERRLRVRAIGTWPERAGTTLRCEVALTPVWWFHDRGWFPADLQFDARGRLVPIEVSLVATHEDDLWAIELFESRSGRTGPLRSFAAMPVTRAEALTIARPEIEAQLDAATITDEGSLRVLRARLELLVDAVSSQRSREFLLATPELANATENEARRLIAGERPYRNAFGDLWRTIAHGRRDLAVRVYMPRVLRVEPWPLVVAFHGAGGDENFLFELAGEGYLKQLADEHGFIVACPMTVDFTLSAPAFDALLAGLAADYSIDPARVFLFGHSMGAGAVSNLCRLRPEAIAKAVCVAGFGGADPRSPPILVLAGELDPIAPPARLQRSAEAARAAGADVTFELLADQGHTLLLPAALRRAVEHWLAE
jgi:predicted esterase